MRIIIMGAGALGGYFGARFQEQGHDVTYVARGSHLEAMQRDGLTVESPLGDIRLPEVSAVENPAQLDAADFVVFAVKNYDLETAAELMLPCLKDDALVVTLQNGVSAPERLAGIIGARRVAPAMIYMPADIREPGIIRHSSKFHRATIGPALEGGLVRVQKVVDAWRQTGVEVTIVEDGFAALWEKFCLIGPMSAITAMTRLNVGPIRDCPESAAISRAAIDEAVAVAKAACPTVRPDLSEHCWNFVQNIQPHVHASMLDDLNRGKPLELNYLSGDISRIGRKFGVPTPTHDFAVDLLQPFVNGAPNGPGA